jgi:hypothetical protein
MVLSKAMVVWSLMGNDFQWTIYKRQTRILFINDQRQLMTLVKHCRTIGYILCHRSLGKVACCVASCILFPKVGKKNICGMTAAARPTSQNKAKGWLKSWTIREPYFVPSGEQLSSHTVGKNLILVSKKCDEFSQNSLVLMWWKKKIQCRSVKVMSDHNEL